MNYISALDEYAPVSFESERLADLRAEGYCNLAEIAFTTFLSRPDKVINVDLIGDAQLNRRLAG